MPSARETKFFDDLRLRLVRRRMFSDDRPKTRVDSAARSPTNTRIPECSRPDAVGTAIALCRCVTCGPAKDRFSVRAVPGDGMRLTTFARCLLPGLLVVGLISLAAPCAAQDADAPTLPTGGGSRGSLVAPSAWMVLTAPVHKQVGINVYGFYIGDLNVPVAQIDVPIRATRFLTITPSYMVYSVPESGLTELASRPTRFTDSYDENQFRIDGTVAFSVRNFEIYARNMYVRRFRPTPLEDMNRYRGRVGVAHPFKVQGRTVKPFASYESFYERTGGWNRDRIWTGVTVPVHKQVMLQPSYLWESSPGSRTINYVLLGLIVNTK
jgi:Protein of unknown function (DUF2490)